MKYYNLLYTDPPWRYDNALGDAAKWGAATSSYPTMSVEELIALDLGTLFAADNCALCLWTTGPKQPEAHEVLRGWGFRFVTILYVWVKLRPKAPRLSPFKYTDLYHGRGQYSRPNCEFMFLATRGYAPAVYETGIPQVVWEPHPGDHSTKPDIFRTLLERQFGDIPRIELFARKRVDGWDSWGNDEALLLK
jgi:N6-adenosine-specific RNA methylase IME4